MAEDAEKKPFNTLERVSFVVLFLAFCFFLYMAFARTALQNRAYFRSLTQTAETQLNALKATKEERMRESAAANGSGETSGPGKTSLSQVPTLLQKINQESIACGLELSTIEKINETTYKLSCFAPFYRLVNFLQRIEDSNLAVQDMDILPFSERQNRIQMVLAVTKDRMSENNLQVLANLKDQADQQFRNPFQKDVGVQETKRAPDVIDLTWKFKLTGIGFDRARYANINHKNYYVGDEFSGMRIVHIENDRVDLAANSQKYMISFRYKRPVSKK